MNNLTYLRRVVLATDVADIILTDPSLTRLCDLLKLSHQLDANFKRGLGFCYTGISIVVLGTFFSHIDILVAMLVHFVLSSGAIGNAMLPLLEIKKKPVPTLPENREPNNPLSLPVVQSNTKSTKQLSKVA